MLGIRENCWEMRRLLACFKTRHSSMIAAAEQLKSIVRNPFDHVAHNVWLGERRRQRSGEAPSWMQANELFAEVLSRDTSWFSAASFRSSGLSNKV